MLTQKTRYALRALLYLIEEGHGGSVQLQRIAETQKIPRKYLELIMLDLKALGIVQSVRGPKGGYRLKRHPNAVVNKVADKRGTRAVSEAYLKFLYTPEAQDIIARNHYRPRNAQVAAKYKSRFPNLKLFTVDRNFGGWKQAQANHFNDGALFDQIFEDAKR